MGFRSTYISEDYAIHYPDWFREKYSVSDKSVIYSEIEKKYPEEVVLDTWKALKEVRWFDKTYDIDFNMVILHECGGVTKVQMGADYLIVADPTDWDVVEHITEPTDWINAQGHHSYCYGCTDLRKYVATDIPTDKEAA